MRKERDSMGEMEVPEDALYGASTQRAVLNFPISDLRLQERFISALGYIKKAAALTNASLGDLDEAFAHMDRALEERPSSLAYIAADPAADPMRNDPRWPEFLERLKPE